MKRNLSLTMLTLCASLPIKAAGLLFVPLSKIRVNLAPPPESPNYWPYIWLGLTLFILYKIIRHRDKIVGLYKLMFHVYRLTPNNPLTTDQQRKILLSAIYSQQQCSKLDSLNTKLSTAYRTGMLEGGWGITNRESAIETLNFLKDEGQRYYFPYVVKALQQPTQEALDNYIKDIIQNEDRAERAVEFIQNVFYSLDELKKWKVINSVDDFINIGVDAWDSGRLSFIVRLCYEAKLISEEETWQYLDAADDIAHNTLSSWNDYSTSYILGRAMGNKTSADGSKFMFEVGQHLLTKKTSPWLKIPFSK